MSATTTQLLSSGQFCKLRYDTIPVKSASTNVSFYTNNPKMPNFELWNSCRKWAIYCWRKFYIMGLINNILYKKPTIMHERLWGCYREFHMDFDNRLHWYCTHAYTDTCTHITVNHTLKLFQKNAGFPFIVIEPHWTL
jgi:hypothetical protein